MNFNDQIPSVQRCQHCNSEYPGFYPVCSECAKFIHFPVRVKIGRDCVHCEEEEKRKVMYSKVFDLMLAIEMEDK